MVSERDTHEAGEETETVARRVTVSYPADLSAWGRDQVATPHFKAYLRKTHDTAESGDTWPEFVGVGCCGNSLDVPLQIERVEGGSRVTNETSIEYEVREACDVQGGWRVQSAGGPTQ
ncbi:hypothetical protein ACFR9U_02945 [Halorientalis brevis]|uniref:DUF7968 domain-containing protein n=1 Tax=Halorientalis brevis TaxID=1126241 RepID=A0ABD6C902_9EURY|nr:hypothetical protein [Halorientalis brevis]